MLYQPKQMALEVEELPGERMRFRCIFVGDDDGLTLEFPRRLGPTETISALRQLVAFIDRFHQKGPRSGHAIFPLEAR